MQRTVIALVCGLAVSSVAVAEQQMFRYLDKDGRTVYTDTAPPADARNVQQKRLGGNYIETSEPPYALQVAQQRNPVTLYAGNCGPLCDASRALLNRRGVPYREIDPSQPAEAQKLKQVTGDMQVPVLTIGGAYVLKGFEEDRWQGALDSAGYPKTPAVRTTALGRLAPDKVPTGSVKTPAKGDVKGELRADAKGDGKGEAAKGDAKGEAKGDARPEAPPVTASAEAKK